MFVVFVVIVAINWGRISDGYARYSSSFAALGSVQSALAKKYDAQVGLVMMRNSAVDGSILSINVMNSPSLGELNSSGPEAREKALEIAKIAQSLLPPNEAYDNYRVVIAEQQGRFIKKGRQVAFMFRAAEVRPSKTP